MQDPIADFITRLKNAGAAGRSTVTLPYSGVNARIAELLAEKGYLESWQQKGQKQGAHIEAELEKNTSGKPRVFEVKRRSKPSKRQYLGADEIFSIRGGYGMLAVSTSGGVMSGQDARGKNLGGEVLFEIW